ncbi:MAG: PQQ-binding-like beta-propeller repeat protein [Bacteroidales bacterium]
MKLTRILLTGAALLIVITSLCAQDWPQYLGPTRNSISPQKNLLRSWPETGPEVLWSVDVGIGYGGPVIKDGSVYLLDRDDAVGDKLRCFDLSTGEERWSFAYDAPGSVMFPGSRSVPAVDGDYVYTCGPYGDLYCIDINTHKPAWNVNVWTDFGGGEIPTWAITQCPLIYGDLLLIASQAPDAGVVAYNKHSGKVVWTTPALGPVGYVSPAIVKVEGEDQVVMITASQRNEDNGRVVGLDPKTGKILWDYFGWNCSIPVPGAIDAGDSKVLIIGGYRAGAVMLKIGKEAGDSYSVTELYRTIDFGEHTKPAILYNGYFYAQYSTNERRDGLVCMSMDGQVMWATKRDPEFMRGSMILADGLILATDGATKLYLIEPDPGGFKPLASAELLAAADTGDDPRAARFGTQNWGPLALADGKLLIRDQSKMLCVRVAE